MRAIPPHLFYVLVLSALLGLSLSGCSGSSSIVGNWAPAGESVATLSFYSNGNLDAPYGGSFSDRSASEKWESASDGTLFLMSALGDTNRTFHRVTTVDVDWSDGYSYYLSGDTLIIDGKEFHRVG